MFRSVGNSVSYIQYVLPPATPNYVTFQTYSAGKPLTVNRMDEFGTNFRRISLSLASPALVDLSFVIEGFISNESGRATETLTLSVGTTESSASTNYYSCVEVTPGQDQIESNALSVNTLDGYVEFQTDASPASLYISTGAEQSWTIKGAMWNNATIVKKDSLKQIYVNIDASLTNQTGTMTYPYYLQMPLGRMQVYSQHAALEIPSEIVFQMVNRQLIT